MKQLLASLLLLLPACSGATGGHPLDPADLPDDDDSGDLPDDDDDAADDDTSGEGGPNLVVLNELLAKNQAAYPDPEDATTGDAAYDDWIELFNPGSSSVDVGGWFLTDKWDELAPLPWDPSSADLWQLPAGTVVDGGEYLLVWADDEPGDGDLHATFKLNDQGEHVALIRPDGSPSDDYAYPPQSPDRSTGRVPDGTGPWVQDMEPTPGSGND